MVSASLLVFSCVGLAGLFTLKIYEIKNHIRLLATPRMQLDRAVDSVRAYVHAYAEHLRTTVTPVRLTLALFGGLTTAITFLLALLEYARARLDTMTRYVAIHYGDPHTTQSLFLQKIAEHKRALKKPRVPRRRKAYDDVVVAEIRVDNEGEVV
jgi:hypothetical protein